MTRLPSTLALAGLLLASNVLADGERSARRQYLLHCTGCHQADGRGAPSSDVPDMRSLIGYMAHDPEGRAYLVKVPGVSNSALNHADTARLLNWMLRSFSAATLPAEFAPFTEAEVTRLRAAPLDDVAATRASVIQRLQARGLPVQ